MAQYQAQLQGFLGNLDANTKSFKFLDQFETKTNLPRSYAVIIGAVGYLFLMFLNIGGIGQLLSNLAGFALPAYLSLQALETTTTSDDTRLLTYWVVFAFLNIVEFWSKAILYWIPTYFVVKTVFLLYLALPQYNGAQKVYQALIRPIAQKYVLKTDVTHDLLNKVNAKNE
ncbi:unnamed protein product [Kuraishia capsulata CBS 1993]|uniref:Protein YOP1 n=1 Tax=Kuraishia capsulata CBS 1993 TaxID=1382522 RepID=W6MMT6_9ASCO|nr:uncharacterized protein KUCA_T00003876001 [Kuraishia capsulata CBS 1993]CDK27896.1 unnamed protein product [Kuraishia capsulata CBS 1993]